MLRSSSLFTTFLRCATLPPPPPTITTPSPFTPSLRSLSSLLNTTPTLSSSSSPLSLPRPFSFYEPLPTTSPFVFGRCFGSGQATPPLDGVVKLELLEKEDPEKIEEIWMGYFEKKNSIAAVVPSFSFENLQKRYQECPMFILPFKESEDRFVPVMLDIKGNVHTFTLVSEIKKNPNGYTPSLIATFYEELSESKGVILMKGDFFGDSLTPEDGQYLMGLAQIFYLQDAWYEKYVKSCNFRPQDFRFEEVAEVLFGTEEKKGEKMKKFGDDSDDDDYEILSISDLGEKK